jgi:hypothetical protein
MCRVASGACAEASKRIAAIHHTSQRVQVHRQPNPDHCGCDQPWSARSSRNPRSPWRWWPSASWPWRRSWLSVSTPTGKGPCCDGGTPATAGSCQRPAHGAGAGHPGRHARSCEEAAARDLGASRGGSVLAVGRTGQRAGGRDIVVVQAFVVAAPALFGLAVDPPAVRFPRRLLAGAQGGTDL